MRATGGLMTATRLVLIVSTLTGMVMVATEAMPKMILYATGAVSQY